MGSTGAGKVGVSGRARAGRCGSDATCAQTSLINLFLRRRAPVSPEPTRSEVSYVNVIQCAAHSHMHSHMAVTLEICKPACRYAGEEGAKARKATDPKYIVVRASCVREQRGSLAADV